MANHYGTNHTAAFQTEPVSNVDAKSFGGRIRALYDEFTVTAALALNDKIYMGRLPKGAKIIEVVLASTDLGSTGDVDVGYEYVDSASGTSDPDAFLDGVDVNAAAVTHVMSAKANMAGFGVEMAGEAYALITMSEASDATSGTIKLCIYYTID